MTNAEARMKIQRMLMTEIDRLPSHYDSEIEEVVYSNTAEVNELLELNKIVSEAFDALELQTPKKPILEKTKGIVGIDMWHCPVCGEEIISEWNRDIANPYCHHCGQRLNWRDEDE